MGCKPDWPLQNWGGELEVEGLPVEEVVGSSLQRPQLEFGEVGQGHHPKRFPLHQDPGLEAGQEAEGKGDLEDGDWDDAEQMFEVAGQQGEGEEGEKRILMLVLWCLTEPAVLCGWKLKRDVRLGIHNHLEGEMGGGAPSETLCVGMEREGEEAYLMGERRLLRDV